MGSRVPGQLEVLTSVSLGGNPLNFACNCDILTTEGSMIYKVGMLRCQ